MSRAPAIATPRRRPGSSAPRKSGSRERLEARITPEQKALLRRAAALEGRSNTSFVVISAEAAALEAIHRHESMPLSAHDSEAFVRALMNPPAPSETLRAAARR